MENRRMEGAAFDPEMPVLLVNNMEKKTRTFKSLTPKLKQAPLKCCHFGLPGYSLVVQFFCLP